MFRAVTTCSLSQWNDYGREMAASHVRHWKDVPLFVYFDRDDHIPVDLFGAYGKYLPAWHQEWKRRHLFNLDAHGMASGSYKYRRDCVKFSHKIAALTAEADQCVHGETLIWLDADIRTDRDVTPAILDGFFPPEFTASMAWLNRRRYYPECGFMMFRTRWPSTRVLMEDMREQYERDLVFALPETHDSFVMEQRVNHWVRHGVMLPPFSLSGVHASKHHPFVHCDLGRYMDHFKGRRKIGKASPERGTR